MDLFKLIGSFFNQKVYDKLKNYDKAKNSFMVNRFCSINFPYQAAFLSRNRVSPNGLVDFWQTILSRQYKGTPFWMFTKTKKKEKIEKEQKVFVPDKELIKQFCRIHECSEKEFMEAKHHAPDLLKKEIEELKMYLGNK